VRGCRHGEEGRIKPGERRLGGEDAEVVGEDIAIDPGEGRSALDEGGESAGYASLRR
jgi:hypothetical protein